MKNKSNKIISLLTNTVAFPLVFAKAALSRFDNKAHLEKTLKQVHSYGKRHEVPDENFPKIGHLIPKHLLDNKGDWLVAADGQPMMTKIHENEVYTGYMSPALPLFYLVGVMLVAMNMVLGSIHPIFQVPMLCLITAYLFMVYKAKGFWKAVLFMMFAFPMSSLTQIQAMLGSIPMVGSEASNLSSHLKTSNLQFILALLPSLFIWLDTKSEVKKYYSSLANHGFDGGAIHSAEINPERLKQAVNAAADTSDIFRFGEAMGVNASKGDVFAPDEGQDFCCSHKDLRTNATAQGISQTGKTSCFLKPYARFINISKFPNEKWNHDSIVVACGKNTLTKDFVEAGFIQTRIHPVHLTNFNWIHQFSVRPEYVSNEIVKAVAGKNQKNDHWTLSGKIAFECSLTIHRALIDMFHGNKSLNSYFGTIRDIQLSMSEADTLKDNPELKKALKGKSEEEQEKIKTEFNAAKKSSIIDKLNGHPDLSNEKSMLSRAISNYEMLYAKTPEERSGVFSTLAAWIDMFTSNELLNEWSFCEETSVNFKQKTEEGDDISLELAEDEFGLPGPILTKLILKFMSTYLINDRPIDHNPDYPYFHFFLDEAHLIADENLADIMSICLSKRFSYKLAFQTDESFMQKFQHGELLLASIKNNCHIRATFMSSKRTLEDFSQSIGIANIIKRVGSQNSMDMIATASSKANQEWFNEDSENRSYLKKWFRNTHKYYVNGEINERSSMSFGKNPQAQAKGNSKPLQVFSDAVRIERSKEPVPIMGMADFTKYMQEKFVCALTVKVGDVPRRDFVRMQPMKNDGTRLDVADLNMKKLLEQHSEIRDNEKKLETV